MSLLPLVAALLIDPDGCPVDAPACRQPPPVAEAPPVAQTPEPAAAVQDPFNIFSLLDLDFALGPWTFHGYIQVDGANYDQAPPGPPEEDFRRGGINRGDPLQARNLEDGAYLRRARFGGEGRLGKNIAYRAMFEFGADDQSEARIAEVWASYSRFAPYSIRIGAFPQPVNMADATGSDDALFMERNTAADLARSLAAGDGRLGVTVKRSDPKWMAAISLTGPQVDSAEDFTPRSAVVGRFSRAVTFRPGISTHVGINGAYVLSPGERKRKPGAPPGFAVRYLATPEIDVDSTPLIDTGDMIADHASVFGLEWAAQRKNLMIQAEAFRFVVQRDDSTGLDDPHFNGFYVQGSWVITGETRRFDQSRGAFVFPEAARPIDGGGWGAWELGFRYSHMDLNHREGRAGEAPSPDGVRGGEQDIYGAALLWYPRPRIRLMLNYLHVKVDRLNPARPLDREPFGPPPATPPVGVQIGQSLNILALRLRYSL